MMSIEDWESIPTVPTPLRIASHYMRLKSRWMWAAIRRKKGSIPVTQSGNGGTLYRTKLKVITGGED